MAMYNHAYNFMLIFFSTNLNIILTHWRINLIIIFILRIFEVLFFKHSNIRTNISLLKKGEWAPNWMIIWKKTTSIFSNLLTFISAVFSWKLFCLARLKIDLLCSFFCIFSTILVASCSEYYWEIFFFSVLKKCW